MAFDRFAYGTNIRRATGYRDWRSPFWPPSDECRVFGLDLSRESAIHDRGFHEEMEILRGLVEGEWHRAKASRTTGRARLHDAGAIGQSLRRLAACLPNEADRRALSLRAEAMERGYDDATLSVLADTDEEVAFVAGSISTWYGKHTGGLPTAFGCVRDGSARQAVDAAGREIETIRAYVRALHSQLRLGPVPAFAPMRLVFMAGEGNRHPKHIAYFLPEDEGVKFSRYKKSFYFVNTHRTLIDAVSLPLARQLLEIGARHVPDAGALGEIPTLGVLAHEMGHFVHREGLTFAALNASDRWVSIALQETAADVFGTLFVAEVLAPRLGASAHDVILYYLAECLRYVDRGLGCFPDSDGMFLQLSYMVAFGVLELRPGAAPLVKGDFEGVIAALRSLARVLADTLLGADAARAMDLYRHYGPGSPERLGPLIDVLRSGPPKTVEYLQEPLCPESLSNVLGAN